MSIVVEVPFSYYIFDKLVLDNFEYTIDVDFWEIGGGVLFIIILALTIEASQTLNAAGSNLSTHLRGEQLIITNDSQKFVQLE